MSKPKYCSWDVRDLASDYNWEEVSDERDTTHLTFQNKSSQSNISLSINMITGHLSVHLLHSDDDRTLVHSELCTDFSDVEKNFNQSEQKTFQLVNEKERDSKNILKLDKCMKPLVTNNDESDEFSKMKSLLQSWDSEEHE